MNVQCPIISAMKLHAVRKQAASCRSQLGNHWCSLFAPPPQAIKPALGCGKLPLPCGESSVFFLRIAVAGYKSLLWANFLIKSHFLTLSNFTAPTSSLNLTECLS